MEGKKYLPIDLVEQIIARMPYPSIFKCRCLSKSWLARFASISSEANRVKKRRAISFQKQVGEWSNSWKTLGPIFEKNKRDFIAYDRVSHKWRRLPSLPLPGGILYGRWGETIQIEGALVYAFCEDNIRSEKYVANIFTGAWKQLPACPNVGVKVLREKLVSCASSEFYKVILLCLCRKSYGAWDDIGRHWKATGQHELCVQIYDSKLNAWSIKKVVFSCNLRPYDFDIGNSCNTMYLNGVLYTDDFQINIEEGTLEKLDVLSGKCFYSTSRKMMANWVGNLLIVLEKHGETYVDPGRGFKVLKFDFQSEQLSELVESSFPALEIDNLWENPAPVFDGHCIYFGVEARGTRILTYDVDKNEWSCLPSPAVTGYSGWGYEWVDSVFQPGLNPFAAV